MCYLDVVLPLIRLCAASIAPPPGQLVEQTIWVGSLIALPALKPLRSRRRQACSSCFVNGTTNRPSPAWTRVALSVDACAGTCSPLCKSEREMVMLMSPGSPDFACCGRLQVGTAIRRNSAPLHIFRDAGGFVRLARLLQWAAATFQEPQPTTDHSHDSAAAAAAAVAMGVATAPGTPARGQNNAGSAAESRSDSGRPPDSPHLPAPAPLPARAQTAGTAASDADSGGGSGSGSGGGSSQSPAGRPALVARSRSEQSPAGPHAGHRGLPLSMGNKEPAGAELPPPPGRIRHEVCPMAVCGQVVSALKPSSRGVLLAHVS